MAAFNVLADVHDHPACQGHPVREMEDHTKHCIPIMIHGDGVPVAGLGKAWSKSAEIISWSSLLAHGPTLLTHYVAFFMYKLLMTQAGMRTCWRILCWSLECLASGVWPHSDHDGIRYPAASKQGHSVLVMMEDTMPRFGADKVI